MDSDRIEVNVYIQKGDAGSGWNSVAECLSSMHKALSSTLSTTQNKKKKKKKEAHVTHCWNTEK